MGGIKNGRKECCFICPWRKIDGLTSINLYCCIIYIYLQWEVPSSETDIGSISLCMTTILVEISNLPLGCPAFYGCLIIGKK